MRSIFIKRNDVPINTWVPWNPVATKKVYPYTLSAMVNVDSKYSINCSMEKYIPNKTCIVDKIAIFRFPDDKLWWANVIVTPELNRIAVFSRGILNGSIVLIPTRGQIQPSSDVGFRLLWKKAQKKKRKKQISLVINSNIPRRRPFCVLIVCFPIYVPSRIMSRHHCNIEAIIDIIPTNKSLLSWK